MSQLDDGRTAAPICECGHFAADHSEASCAHCECRGYITTADRREQSLPPDGVAAYSPDPHGFDLPDAPVVLRGYSVACPLCHRRVVTTEAPCECGFRFPRGYGEPLDVEARDIGTGDDLFGAGVVTSAVWVGGSVQVEAGGTTMTFYADEVVTVRGR